MHILPLLMADHPFLDDYARAQMARNDWSYFGRPLMVALFAALSFGPGAVDLYPLPLLLAVVVSGFALARLVVGWFPAPTVSAVWVVLPLWLQPYFLQNLSYQYDGAAMALSLSAALWAVMSKVGRLGSHAAGMALVAAAAALYQPSVNVFIGLCGMEAMLNVMNGDRAVHVYRHALARVGQLLGGLLVYYASSAWMVTSTRGEMLPLNSQWLEEVTQRLQATAEVVGLLVTPWSAWVFITLLALAVACLLHQLMRLWRADVGIGGPLSLSIALLLGTLTVVLCVPGLILFLAAFEKAVRVLMGLGVLLMLIQYLAYAALAGWPRVRVLVLGVPVLFMLSFSFAYGRVMLLQKELHQAVTQSLVHDLQSQPQLNQAKHFYVLDFWLKRPWIPAAAGTLEAMPAMAMVHAYNFIVLPEMLPRAGIDDLHSFYQTPPLNRQQVMAQSPTPVLSSRLYDLYRVADDVYVLIKPPEGYGQ
ncbi:glucosyltransferase domain-containing protein [Pantoea sp. Ap-967]|uniref:glucosyltransferase domain-containing protein n=1 Tax=Pantoea sp. Ap-967 TaxID=2608362 RepID=UPI00142403F3